MYSTGSGGRMCSYHNAWRYHSWSMLQYCFVILGPFLLAESRVIDVCDNNPGFIAQSVMDLS